MNVAHNQVFSQCLNKSTIVKFQETKLILEMKLIVVSIRNLCKPDVTDKEELVHDYLLN